MGYGRKSVFVFGSCMRGRLVKRGNLGCIYDDKGSSGICGLCVTGAFVC